MNKLDQQIMNKTGAFKLYKETDYIDSRRIYHDIEGKQTHKMVKFLINYYEEKGTDIYSVY